MKKTTTYKCEKCNAELNSMAEAEGRCSALRFSASHAITLDMLFDPNFPARTRKVRVA